MMSAERASKNVDAIYRAIGRFIVGYSDVEQTIRILLAMELRLRTDLHDPILTHDFALLCTAFLKVFEGTVGDKNEYEGLRKLINKCRELNDLRVKVVHGGWGLDSEGGHLSHVSRRNLQSGGFVKVKDLLEKKADEAVEIQDQLEMFFHAHSKQKKARRERRRKIAAIGRLFG